MSLTDKEKEQLKAMIDKDEKLPAKYKSKLFENNSEVELVWAGKTSEVTNVVLPFQSIEQIDEPRLDANIATGKVPLSLFSVDNASGRQQSGWSNKLIWGDNKLVLSSLKNGYMREEIEKAGGLKLVYIDPPFDVGADFSMNHDIGDEQLTKEPSIIEELAYRDTWGRGKNSFISMMYERLTIANELLSDHGSIYVHCDWRVTALIRLIMDEIFSNNNFRNEIIWCYKSGGAGTHCFAKKHDTIHYYTKSADFTFNVTKEKSYMGIGYNTGNQNVKLNVANSSSKWLSPTILLNTDF